MNDGAADEGTFMSNENDGGDCGLPEDGSLEDSEEERPHAGEELGGASASVCPGFDPELLRYLFYEPGMRILIIFGAVVALLTLGAFAAGNALRAPGGGWWPGLLALLCYGVGLLLGFVLLLDLIFLGMGYGASARYFKNALLTPGVIVSSNRLAIVVLAPLGNGKGPHYHGLQRLDLRFLPFHSHTPGTRIPVVSAFQPAEGLDRWLAFNPEPICWGTGRKDLIGRCFERLGTEDFDRLDACVARGLIPRDDDELILLDEHDRRLNSFSIREEQKKYAPKTDGQ
jgi:hypothetical protein